MFDELPICAFKFVYVHGRQKKKGTSNFAEELIKEVENE